MPFLPFRRLRHWDDDGARSALLALSGGLCVATATLLWLGFVAIREWSRGTDALFNRHQMETLALVGTALNRDMRGVWATVIVPINHVTLEEDPPYDLVQLTARAFARFPYPESFIIWKDNGLQDGLTYVFNRADRRPHWDTRTPTDDPFPVALMRDPPELSSVIATMRELAKSGNSLALLETNIAGTPYQIVAHLMFASTAPHTLSGLAAFTVNMHWVKDEYFGPLLVEVGRIAGNEDTLSLAVIDDGGLVVAATGTLPSDASSYKLPVPMLFLDPALASSLPSYRTGREWTVHVRPSRLNTRHAALQGAQRMFALMALSSTVTVLALLLIVRAVRSSALVASMKSDFVSSVTHELKTPLALIRLVGDTLASGRYSSTETVHEYARLLSQEASRLSQSIDKLLTSARYSNLSKQAIALTPTNVGDVVEGALESFMPLLEERGFQFQVDVPRDLPRIRADRPAMIQVVGNVIDNAIKYSGDRRVLSIIARAHGKYVRITIEDHGSGIAKEDIGQVFVRFYRGRNAKTNGSGLGLAIAQRILRYHGGRIDIRSTLNVGTAVDLLLVAVHES